MQNHQNNPMQMPRRTSQTKQILLNLLNNPTILADTHKFSTVIRCLIAADMLAGLAENEKLTWEARQHTLTTLSQARCQTEQTVAEMMAGNPYNVTMPPFGHGHGQGHGSVFSTHTGMYE